MTEEKAIPENERPQDESNIASEFAALGKKFAEAMKTAWNSEERHQLQSELKEGLDKFTEEVNGAVVSLRETEVAKKVSDTVNQAASDVKSKKVSGEVKKGVVSALRGLSNALERMAESFTAPDEAPKE